MNQLVQKRLSATLHDVRCPHDYNLLSEWVTVGGVGGGGVTAQPEHEDRKPDAKRTYSGLNRPTVAQRMPLFTTRVKVQYKRHYKSVQNVK